MISLKSFNKQFLKKFPSFFMIFRPLFSSSFLKTLGWFLHWKTSAKNLKKKMKNLKILKFFFYPRPFLIADFLPPTIHCTLHTTIHTTLLCSYCIAALSQVYTLLSNCQCNSIHICWFTVIALGRCWCSKGWWSGVSSSGPDRGGGPAGWGRPGSAPRSSPQSPCRTAPGSCYCSDRPAADRLPHPGPQLRTSGQNSVMVMILVNWFDST